MFDTAWEKRLEKAADLPEGSVKAYIDWAKQPGESVILTSTPNGTDDNWVRKYEAHDDREFPWKAVVVNPDWAKYIEKDP